MGGAFACHATQILAVYAKDVEIYVAANGKTIAYY